MTLLFPLPGILPTPDGHITSYVQISGQILLNQRLLPETQTKDSIRSELGTCWSDFAVTMLHLNTHTHTHTHTHTSGNSVLTTANIHFSSRGQWVSWGSSGQGWAGLGWAPDTGWSAGLPQVSSTLESGLKEPHYWGHMVLVAGGSCSRRMNRNTQCLGAGVCHFHTYSCGQSHGLSPVSTD